MVTCSKIVKFPLPFKMVESMSPLCTLVTVVAYLPLHSSEERNGLKAFEKPKTNWRQAYCRLAVMKEGTVLLNCESRKCDGWSYVIDSSVVISIVYI